jgi:hypothetical protein
MSNKRQILIGMALMAAGLVGFFVSMSYFQFFNTNIKYDLSSLLTEIIPYLFLTIGVYGIGYLDNGNKNGIKWASRFVLALIGAIAIHLIFFNKVSLMIKSLNLSSDIIQLGSASLT